MPSLLGMICENSELIWIKVASCNTGLERSVMGRAFEQRQVRFGNYSSQWVLFIHYGSIEVFPWDMHESHVCLCPEKSIKNEHFHVLVTKKLAGGNAGILSSWKKWKLWRRKVKKQQRRKEVAWLGLQMQKIQETERCWDGSLHRNTLYTFNLPKVSR